MNKRILRIVAGVIVSSLTLITLFLIKDYLVYAVIYAVLVILVLTYLRLVERWEEKREEDSWIDHKLAPLFLPIPLIIAFVVNRFNLLKGMIFSVVLMLPFILLYILSRKKTKSRRDKLIENRAKILAAQMASKIRE